MSISHYFENEEDLKRHLLDLDSEFRFKCRMCGKCYKHQNTILLNSRDIFNIARRQERPMAEVLRDYTEVYLGKRSRVPVVHLLAEKRCPLLAEDGTCSVHDCKPTVCALYPLGRVYVPSTVQPKSDAQLKAGVYYILNDITCGSCKKVWKVRDWLAQFNIPEDDEFYRLWSQMLADLGMAVRRVEELHRAEEKQVLMPPPLLMLLWREVFPALYIDYDIGQDFMPQFRAALERITELMKRIR